MPTLNIFENTDGSASIASPKITTIRDVDEINSAAIDAGFDCAYQQLEPGPLIAQSMFAQIDDVSVVHEKVNKSLEYRGAQLFGRYTLLYLKSQSATRVAGTDPGTGKLWLIPPSYELSMITGGFIDVYSVSISVDELKEVLPSQSLGSGLLDFKSPLALRLLRRDEAEFRACLSACFMANSNQSIHFDIAGQLLRCVANVLTKNRRTKEIRTHKDYQNFRRLIEVADYIEDNIDRAVSVDEMVEISGYSSRTLNRHFSNNFGMSPYLYSRMKRLDAARKAISASPLQTGIITRVALEQGFDHLGRFSEDFKKHFGVLPSDYAQLKSLEV